MLHQVHKSFHKQYQVFGLNANYLLRMRWWLGLKTTSALHRRLQGFMECVQVQNSRVRLIIILEYFGIFLISILYLCHLSPTSPLQSEHYIHCSPPLCRYHRPRQPKNTVSPLFTLSLGPAGELRSTYHRANKFIV